jgi:hypothetical protein
MIHLCALFSTAKAVKEKQEKHRIIGNLQLRRVKHTQGIILKWILKN